MGFPTRSIMPIPLHLPILLLAMFAPAAPPLRGNDAGDGGCRDAPPLRERRVSVPADGR
jgi:hypothetical protein